MGQKRRRGEGEERRGVRSGATKETRVEVRAGSEGTARVGAEVDPLAMFILKLTLTSHPWGSKHDLLHWREVVMVCIIWDRTDSAEEGRV